MKKKLFLFVAALFVTTFVFTQSAFAHGNSGDTKPGWGHGDKNHVHTGPPGHSVRPGHKEYSQKHKKFQQFLTAWFQYLREHPWKWNWHHNS